MKTKRLMTCVLGSALVAPLLVACQNGLVDPGPTLRVPEVRFGIRMSNVKTGVAYSFDDVTLCLHGPGTVTVESVELANPQGGLTLRRFSVRADPEDGGMSYIQDARTTLAAVGYPAEEPFKVEEICHEDREEASDDPISLLGIEVERAAGSPDEPAYQTGLVVHYRSGGERRSAFVGFSLVLCPGATARRPDCDIDEVRPPD